MATFFFNGKPLLLLEGEPHQDKFPTNWLVVELQAPADLQFVRNALTHVSSLEGAALWTTSPHFLHDVLEASFEVLHAGGGLVLNPEGKALFIHRLGHWDLPKGKVEKGETLEETALREVAEECGLYDLSIVRKLCTTYHVYEHHGKELMKAAHWYLIQCSDPSAVPTPQLEEHIEDARWIAPEQWHDYIHLSYPTIKEVFEAYGA
jgi:8-oxo-dGTP pyrophosphatase MutT (NUDIX family)